MRYYAIHGFVRVEVDERVGAGRLSSIDTQLSGFRAEAPGEARAVLRVWPYAGYRRTAPATQARRGVLVAGSGVDFTADTWAVTFAEGAIDLYFGARSQPLGPYIQLLLAPQGASLVHAAAVEREGRVLLIPAFGGAGKTATSVTLVREGAARFMGDDVVILSADGTVWAFPRALILYPHHRSVLPEYFARRGAALTAAGRLNRIRRAAWRNFPLKPLARGAARRLGLERVARAAVETHEYLAAVPPTELFGAGAVASRGALDTVIALDRGDVEEVTVRPVDAQSLSRRLFAIIHHEWEAYWEPLLLAGGAGLIDLPGYYATTEATIASALARADCSQLLTVPFTFPGERVAAYLPGAWAPDARSGLDARGMETP